MAAFKSCIGGAHRVRGLKPKVLYLHDGREGQQICRLLRTAGALQNKRHQKSAWFASACPFFIFLQTSLTMSGMHATASNCMIFFLRFMSQQVHLIPALRKGDPADNVSSFGK